MVSDTDPAYGDHLRWLEMGGAEDKRNPYKHERRFIECPQCHFIDTYFVDKPTQCRSCKNTLG